MIHVAVKLTIDVNSINHSYLLEHKQGDVEEDEMIPDKESDIKPRFHKSRTHSNQKSDDGEVSKHC